MSPKLCLTLNGGRPTLRQLQISHCFRSFILHSHLFGDIGRTYDAVKEIPIDRLVRLMALTRCTPAVGLHEHRNAMVKLNLLAYS